MTSQGVQLLLRVERRRTSPHHQQARSSMVVTRGAPRLTATRTRWRLRLEHRLTLPLLRLSPAAVELAERRWQAAVTFANTATDFFASRYLPIERIYRLSIGALAGHLLLINRGYALDTILHLPVVWKFSVGVSFSVILTIVAVGPHAAMIIADWLELLAVNCLFPLAIPTCTVMFLLEVLSWESSIRILASMWLAKTMTSYFVHFVLYRCLRHSIRW
jgi:hypothetical protein